MAQVVEIRIAELFAGKSGETILTNGIGSCIVIILHDPLARVGGMSHAILPRQVAQIQGEEVVRGPDALGRYESRYADQSIDMLVKKIEELGGVKERLIAKLVGGADMFFLLEGVDGGVGVANVLAARERLREYHIPIKSEVVGGSVGRNARVDLSTGIVEIVTKV